jgi:predicted Na+-dependent transporter
VAQTIGILIVATLFTTMFALGMGLSLEEARKVQNRPGLLIRVLIGTCLLVPLVALLLLKSPLPLSQPGQLAIALMAVCPSAPLTLRKAGKVGGDRDLAAVLQVSAAILAILTVPLMAEIFTRAFGTTGWDISPAQVAPQIFQKQLLPLGCGILLRLWQPRWANQLQNPVSKIAGLLLTILSLLILIKLAPDILQFLQNDLSALIEIAVMVIVSLSIGHFLAREDEQERTTIALVTSMRNPGLALLLANTYAAGVKDLKLGILAYLLITILLSIPYLKWRKSLAPI